MTHHHLTNAVLLSMLAWPVDARMRGGGGGGMGGGGGETSGNISAHPPGAHCGASSGCSSPASYVAPLPIPTEIDATNGGSLTVVSSKGCSQVFHDSNGNACGSATEIWSYDSSSPGPVIRAKKGVPLSVKHVNNLGQDYENNDIKITTHHHGLKLAPAYDGHAQPDYVTDSSFAIDPAGIMGNSDEFTYEIPNEQEPGTHWFHDHKMHDTGRNVVMGLAGMYLIDPNEDVLYDNVRDSLPSGDYEVPLVFKDFKFTSKNQFDYPMNHAELLSSGLVGGAGYLGDKMLVNGVYAPYLEVKRTWYRFRILNGCNARQLRLEVQRSGGSREDVMYQIGTEGGHIVQRKLRSNIYMAPGERYDILVDFRSFGAGTSLYLRNTQSQSPSITSMMKFSVVSGSSPSYNIPTSLVPYTYPSNASKTRRLDLLNPASDGAWTIEGLRYQPNVANFQVRRGDTETWTFAAAMMMMHPHPMHVHLVQFHIDGVSTGSLEDGWKDIVMVPGSGTRSVTATFEGEPGIYMFHCHNLEHEDWDMMLQYEICDDSADHPCDESLLGAFVSGGGGGGGGMHGM